MVRIKVLHTIERASVAPRPIENTIEDRRAIFVEYFISKNLLYLFSGRSVMVSLGYPAV
jgi:hypothetical protein